MDIITPRNRRNDLSDAQIDFLKSTFIKFLLKVNLYSGKFRFLPQYSGEGARGARRLLNQDFE